MADDKVLSMSLDEIIKLKKTGGNSENQNPNSKKQHMGTRGRGANYRVKRGKPRTSLVRPQIRKTGANLQNVNRQRQFNIALGRSRLQVAKRFLNQRQRGGGRGILMHNTGARQRNMSGRGMGQRFKRGRGGVNLSGLTPNTFRSDQILRLSRVNSYQNKMNRRLSALRRTQVPTGPSLIVSIENDRAGSSATDNFRGVRRRGAMARSGSRNRQQTAPLRRVPEQNYQQQNAMPYHTGALDPEIQMVIADIQGKRKPNNFGPVNNNVRRGSGVRRGIGVGRMQRFGRGQLARGNVNLGRLNPGLPFGITVNTLNERFGGMR